MKWWLLTAMALVIALAGAATQAVAAGSPPSAPYGHIPAPGEIVRLDGTLGGAQTAWAYADQFWLEEYLKITIDAAAGHETYSQASGPLGRVADHVTSVPNGTRASVESVQPFSYNSRLDVEVRVLVQDGPMKGRELWTTCAELVDPAGHPYLRM